MSDDIKTSYKIGQDNITPFGLDIHNPVFLISGLSIVAFVLITLMFQEGAAAFFGWLRPAITSTFDWFFLSAANIFVLFGILLVVTPLGKVRLGPGCHPGFQLYRLVCHVVCCRYGDWSDVLRGIGTYFPFRVFHGRRGRGGQWRTD